MESKMKKFALVSLMMFFATASQASEMGTYTLNKSRSLFSGAQVFQLELSEGFQMSFTSKELGHCSTSKKLTNTNYVYALAEGPGMAENLWGTVFCDNKQWFTVYLKVKGGYLPGSGETVSGNLRISDSSFDEVFEAKVAITKH
ncbi:hypothetical protein Bdt_0087 [Bdellovibrio bacteriovorus str. Tiberius]|uniref:Uncharacterized protein n=2 Tax=Bdellovibrio bacteriovorus TaxID=959 RepID=K7YT77_BDEBC|nr:hypothetical protein Bdt_0087 [Bdellovibrio bacteriovorus str. Tiberius]